MKITVQFPTFGRRDKFIAVLKRYVDTLSGKHDVFFNINCDLADLSMTHQYARDAIKSIFSNSEAEFQLHFDANTTKISAINSHAEDRPFDIIVCASDDMVPVSHDWDEDIAINMQLHFPELDGCVHFDDGNTGGKLITFSILGKRLYDYFGYIYHPDYKSLYCDDEFTQQVRAANLEVYIPRLLFKHEHWSIDGSQNHNQFDIAVHKTLHYSGRDQAVFEKRKKLAFPKERITND
jgi:hypothetical protein